MADGVLHQRLQDEIRDCGAERVRVDGEAHGQPILKACSFNFQIAFQEPQFLLQRHLLAMRLAKCVAQQIRQAHQDTVRRIDVFVHQRGDGFERVEQEVRMQLHL